MSDDRSLSIVSRPKRLQLFYTAPPSVSMWPSNTAYGWGLSSHLLNVTNARIATTGSTGWGFAFTSTGYAWSADIPFWCPLLAAAALCILLKPPPRLRFGLSTILIVFACVSLVLGMFKMLDNAAVFDRKMHGSERLWE